MGWGCPACSATNVDGTSFCGYCGAPRAEAALNVAGAAVDGAFAADESRLVTVLFADVAGFTALSEQLDPDALVEVMDPVLACMGRVVRRYGGTTSKYAGDAVLALFGAPVAHDDDAIRAVLAAVDMRREVAEVAATMSGPASGLGLHIGVNTGRAISGSRGGESRLDYSVLGDAVNVAQRLETAAPPGEIYVGELTRQLAARAVSFEPLGELTVKGKTEGVRAWRVSALSDTGWGVRAPTESPLVGRHEQLTLLRDALRSSTRAVAVAGEAGVGKTRLVHEVRRQAVAGGRRWLTGRCVSFGATTPYRPYVDLFHELTGVSRDAPAEHLAEALRDAADRYGVAEHAPFLTRLVLGDPDADRAALTPQAVQLRIQGAIIALLSAVAAQQPLVVMVEDLHWVDDASLELSRALLAHTTDIALTLMVTLRPEGSAALGSIVAESGIAVQVDLAALDAEGVTPILRAVLGGDVDRDVAEFVFAQTAGNPLFVEEIARQLRDREELRLGQHGWTLRRSAADVAVPASLESVIAARIDLLPAPAARTLAAASVIGREVPIKLLTGLLEHDPDDTGAGLDVLIDRGFVDALNDERVRLHHALVQSVAYARLRRRQRTALHRNLVDVATRLYGDGDDVIDLLARHAYLGDMGDGALPYIERAAARATALFANVEAMGYLAQAIDIVAADESRRGELGDLLMKRGVLLDRTGRFTDAAADYHQAYDVCGDATAALAEAVALYRIDRYAECLQLVDEVRRTHPELTTQQRATLALIRARLMVVGGKAAEAARVLSDGLADVYDAGAAGSVAEVELRLFRGRVRSVLGASDEAIDDLESSIATLEAAGDLPRLATALRTLGGALIDADIQERGVDTLERALEVARKVGHAEEIGAASLNLGWAKCEQRRFEEALVHTEEAMAAFASMGLMSGVANAKVNKGDILLDMDRLAEAKAVALDALALSRDTGNERWRAGAMAVIAEVAFREGDYAASEDYSAQSVQIFESLGDEYHASLGRQRIEKARAGAAASTS